MNKRKLSSRKSLRKEILRRFEEPFPAKIVANFHWQVLEKLIQEQVSLPSGLKPLFLEVSASRSIETYFQLQQLNDPQLYRSPDEFKASTAVLSFLKKFPFGKVAGLDPDGVARRNFFRAEKLCRITNKRLRWYRTRGYRHKNRWQSLHSILHTARLLISDWLGPLDLNEVYDYTRHGPGGVVGVSGQETTTYFKYAAASYTVTTRALPLAEAVILADPLWRRYVVNPGAILGDPVPTPFESREAIRKRLKVIDYNKVTFVPKTAQTHRAIAIEPLMNIYLQLGIGDLLRDKLAKQGVNLRSQAKNQNLAREGSDWNGPIQLRPATLDLSMASDTVSLELVRELFPEDWFDLLDTVRSHFGMIDEEKVRWAKFSSMGNGFTFQLESMIFYALARSVAKHYGFERSSVTVYGDDLICPGGMALPYIDALSFVGFRINTGKSFIVGPFRESCGQDWFEGRNVRPFFLKRKIENAQALVFIVNSNRGSVTSTCCDVPYNASGGIDNVNSFCLRRIPQVVADNLLGPITQDLEGHIHAPWDYSQKSGLVSWNRDYQTWTYASVKASAVLSDGEAGPIILQLMDRNSCRSTFSEAREFNPSRSFLDRLLALEAVEEMAEPLKLSKVSRRKSTKLRLATLTSYGWRND